MIRYESVNERGRALCHSIRHELGEEWDGDALVFVGALGICVRKILPSLADKHSGEAVVCVDSGGRYIIPVVGGHVGRANDLARRIAHVTGGEAVVTTQSDNLHLWALDTLACESGWGMRPVSNEDMNRMIALFVGGERTALVLEHSDRNTERMEQSCPDHVAVFHGYNDFLRMTKEEGIAYKLLIIISCRLYSPCGIPTLQYCPRSLHLGIGCQRLAPREAAMGLLHEVEESGYAPQSIADISTICLKKDEPLLAELHNTLPWAEVKTYSAEVLAAVEVPNPSEKVLDTVGSYSVAEAAALLSSKGGTMVVPKRKGCLGTSHYTFALCREREQGGQVEIVGAGPGDPDLVSVRGRRLLGQADLILYAGSLVPRELTACAKEGAVVKSSASMSLDEQVALMLDYYERGKLVVRLHTGDPCLYGAIAEQMARFDALGVSYRVTPGISSFQAAAAALASELTIPGGTQTVILTRGEGRTPVPGTERLDSLARHGASMCIFLSASLADEVQEALMKGGYAADTPVAICHKVTHPDQRIYRCRLDQLAETMRSASIRLTAMIVVGEAVGSRKGESRLYDSSFTHLFRKGEGEG